MAFALFNSIPKKKRDQVVSIDLGSRTTKAVLLQRRGDDFLLVRYALVDAPIFEKNLSAEMLGEHLKSVCQALEPTAKFVTLAIGVNDAIVRHSEMPPMPVEDMRLILKNNSKTYLQQDLPNHAFDLYIIPPRAMPAPAEATKAVSVPVKHKIIVAGAKRQFVDDCITAIKTAGMTPDRIAPGIIGPVNAFEMAMADVFHKESVALVDIGFKNSSISILQEGELVLSRVVAIGGDKLTAGLAEAMGISYAEAEGIKIGMPNEVQQHLEAVIIPLGRELRASIDFFEHQRDKPIATVYLSGGSARSDFIVQMLQNELIAQCKTSNRRNFSR